MSASERNFSVIEYFKRRAAEIEPRLGFNTSGHDFTNWKNQLTSELKRMLGTTPKPADLNPEVVWEVEEDGLIRRRVLLDTERDMSMAALVYIPVEAKKRPVPAIFCSHGHGDYAKDSVMGVRNEFEPKRAQEIAIFNYDYGLQMAKRGYATMSIDYRCFGERGDGGDPYQGRDQCDVNYNKGALIDTYMLNLAIWDAMRAVDYLCGLEYVDAGHIGAMGLSFGGTMTTWLAIMDDRIKAADIICYSCRFASFVLDRGSFCGSQYVPGLYAVCDVPDLHGLIAPKPLLAEIGLHDLCFRADEALSCSRAVAKIYEAAGVPQNYETDVFPGAHRFNGKRAFDFFDKHLKNLMR